MATLDQADYCTAEPIPTYAACELDPPQKENNFTHYSWPNKKFSNQDAIVYQPNKLILLNMITLVAKKLCNMHIADAWRCFQSQS